MKKRTITSQMIKLSIIGFAIVLAVVFLILAIGWWQGWQTEAKFKTAITIAGITLLGTGLLGAKGGWEKIRNLEPRPSISPADLARWERAQHTLVDFSQAFKFLLVCFVAGAICLAIGWLM